MTSPPASPGSPPALALVHHPHVPTNGATGGGGGYITPPTIYNVAHPSHMQVVSMSMDPCYSAHLAWWKKKLLKFRNPARDLMSDWLWLNRNCIYIIQTLLQNEVKLLKSKEWLYDG